MSRANMCYFSTYQSESCPSRFTRGNDCLLMLDADTLIIQKLLQPLPVDLELSQSILIMCAAFYVVIPIQLVSSCLNIFWKLLSYLYLERKINYSEWWKTYIKLMTHFRIILLQKPALPVSHILTIRYISNIY